MQTPRLVCVACATLCVTVAIAQDNLNWKPPMSAGSGGDYLSSQALFQAGMVKHWQLKLPLGPGQEVTDAYLVDDQIYCGTNDGYVFAIHAPTGALRWARGFTRGGYRLRRPVHIGERTIIVTPPRVTQYDRQYGKPLMRMELQFPSGTAPTTDGANILLGGLDRRMYSFQTPTGYERWKIGADAQLVSAPVVMGEFLYFASDTGTVYSGNAVTKQFQWINRSIGPVTADLVADENGVYVASRDRSLYILDPAFGGTRWRVRMPSALHEAPVTTPDLAFQYCEGHGLSAIEAKGVNVDDRIRWTVPNGRKALTIDEERAYLLSNDGKLLLCDLETGAVKHEVPAEGFTLPMPFTKLPVVYVASPDGRIFAARKRGTRVVTADRVLAAMELPKEPTEEGEAEAPAAARETLSREDVLGTRQGGPPIGGKSKVSKEFQGQQNEPGTP